MIFKEVLRGPSTWGSLEFGEVAEAKGEVSLSEFDSEFLFELYLGKCNLLCPLHVHLLSKNLHGAFGTPLLFLGYLLGGFFLPSENLGPERPF